MATNFTKMNSQGNDFIVIDTAQEKFLENQDNIKKICSRDDVGCDQLLLINTENPNKVTCKIYNSDGSAACQCGNGLRAIMLYLNKKFQIAESIINVCDVDYKAHIIDGDTISVELGSPTFPVSGSDGKISSAKYLPVFIGNLHCVVFSQIEEYERDFVVNRLLQYNDKANVTFVLNVPAFKLGTVKHLEVKVKERGAGWTKSCGSGAAAAAAFIIKSGLGGSNLQPPINVKQEGGVLGVSWEPGHTSLKLLGPSEIEYDGVWNG